MHSTMKILSPTVLRHFSTLSPFQRVSYTVRRIGTPPSYFRVTQCTFSTQDRPVVPKKKTRKPLKTKEDITSIIASEETTFDAFNIKSRKIPNNALSNKVITALETFKQKFGNLLVPARFSIPTNDTTTTASNEANINITTNTNTTTITSKDSSKISSKKKRKGGRDTSPWPKGMHSHISLTDPHSHLSALFSSLLPCTTLIHLHTYTLTKIIA